MRILIDECVDPRVSQLFAGHEVSTVHEQGWDALEDGELLLLTQNEFDVFLTIDRGLEFQQNLSRFKLGIIIVHVAKNQLPLYRLIETEILEAVEMIRPGQALHVGV